MYINPGGVVTSGMASMMHAVIRPPVATLCIGQVASMGSLLLCAGEGDAVCAGERPHHGAPAIRRVQGQASDIERHAEDIIKMKRRLNEIYVKHTGQSYETIERTLDRDYFMTAEQACEFGIVDRVLTKREEFEASVDSKLS